MLGAGRYNVHVVKVDDATSTSLEAAGTGVNATGLRPGAWYEFRVDSVGAMERTNTDPSVSARAQTGELNVSCRFSASINRVLSFSAQPTKPDRRGRSHNRLNPLVMEENLR